MGGIITLRGAYKMAKGSVGAVRSSVVGGFGLRLSNYQLDASINPMSALGTVTKFTFTLRFGREPELTALRSRPKAKRN